MEYWISVECWHEICSVCVKADCQCECHGPRWNKLMDVDWAGVIRTADAALWATSEHARREKGLMCSDLQT